MVRPVRREVKGENFNVFIFHQADAQREFKERASVAVDWISAYSFAIYL